MKHRYTATYYTVRVLVKGVCVGGGVLICQFGGFFPKPFHENTKVGVRRIWGGKTILENGEMGYGVTVSPAPTSFTWLEP